MHTPSSVEPFRSMSNIIGLTVAMERVFAWWDYVVFLVLSCLGFAAIAFFLSSWFRLREWSTVPAIMVVMTLMVLVILVNNQSRWFLLPWMRSPKPMTPKPHWK